MSDDLRLANSPDHAVCGCCGRTRPRSRLAELGDTQGTIICARCALWAAARMTGRARAWRTRLRLPHCRSRSGVVTSAVPLLATTDLDRTAQLYAAAGFSVTGRHDGYLVLHAGPVELHFADDAETTPGACYLHVDDVEAVRGRLEARGGAFPGPLVDTDYGLREFRFTDPDGNRVRVGST